MKTKLFLFHGMGVHSDGSDGSEAWHQPIVHKLNELHQRAEYKNLNLNGAKTLNDRVDIIPVNYDSVFVDLLRDWANDAEALGSGGVGPTQVTQLVGWLRGASRDDFSWTHAGDVLIYRIFSLVRERIKRHCADQILPHIGDDELQWVVMAHSLGTAVAHDTLDMIWTGRLEDGGPTGFEPHNEQASGIFMIANVSRILQTRRKVLESTVRPGARGQTDRGVLRYVNVNHDRDPFTIPKKFNPIDWPEQNDEERFLNVELNHIHNANVHDFLHYLDHPSVHIPLFQALTYEKVIAKDLKIELENDYPRFRGMSVARGLELRGLLEDNAPGIGDTWESIGKIGRLFGDFLENV